MAAGDISNFVVNADGVSGSFRVADLLAGVPTQFESGKAAVLNVSSDGYTGTTLTTSTGWTGDQAIAFDDATFVPTGTTYVQDSFTEGSDTNLTAHTPNTDVEAGGWTVVGGSQVYTVETANGRCHSTTSAGGVAWGLALCDAGVADGRQSVLLKGGSTNTRLGPVFRSDGTVSNYWRVEFFTNSATGVRITKVVGGSVINVQTVAGTGNTLTTGDNTCEVVLSGSSIKVFLNGALILDITDSSLSTNTFHGFGSLASALPEFDNYAFSQNAGYVEVDFTCQQPIHDADTIAITADAGLVTDGTTASNAASAISGTNSSAIANFKPECNQFYFVQDDELLAPRSIIAGLFDFDVRATHGYGISAVRVTFSDGVNSDVVASQTAMSRSAFRDALYADFMEARGYTFTGNLPVYRFADVDISSLDDGEITVTVEAIPKRGGSADIRSMEYTIYHNGGATYSPATRYVNSNGTLTVSALSADITVKQLITGGTSGAKAIVAANASSGATSLSVWHMGGTFTAAETLTITNADENTVATATFALAVWSGSDSNDGSSGTPYRSLTTAVTAVRDTGSGYGTVVCNAAGWYTIPLLAANVQKEGWIEITRGAGLAQTDVVIVQNTAAATKIPFLKLKGVTLELGRNFGSSKYGDVLLSGSSALIDALWLDDTKITHWGGRDVSVVVTAPVNQSNFNDNVYLTNSTSTEHNWDGFTFGEPYVRNCTATTVGLQVAIVPRGMMAFCATDVKLSPNQFEAQSGTVTGSDPSPGDYVYQASSGTWALLYDVEQTENIYFLTLNPAGGPGDEASSVRDFDEAVTVAFYTDANFDQGAGTPSGSSLGGCSLGLRHPDGIQFSNLTLTDQNTIISDGYVEDCEGQLLYSTRGDTNITFVNYLAVRFDGSVTTLSQVGADDGSTYPSQHNIKVWNTSLVNQEFYTRPATLNARVGFQVRNVIAESLTGDVGLAGSYAVNNVARASGSSSTADATLELDCFFDSIGPTDAYSASSRDFRPSADMPLTDDVPWPYDMLGNALVGDGSDYLGAVQEAGDTPPGGGGNGSATAFASPVARPVARSIASTIAG